MSNKVETISHTPLRLRGRLFGIEDIKLIQSLVKEHFDGGRTKISKAICEELDWRQPNGWLKDRACREVLRKLDEMKIVNLPISKKPKQNKVAIKRIRQQVNLDYSVDQMPNNIKLEFAKGNKLEEIWNELVERYHYLGHNVVVGRCIKYLIYGDGLIIGAIAFSSPANRLGARDSLLEKDFGLASSEIRDFIINNSRFLILPNVNVKNLGSTLLSLASKRVINDWRDYYRIEPILIETFVQRSKFKGTCYIAANWLFIGDTQGFSKKGNIYTLNNEPKMIFLYGLNKLARKQLRSISKTLAVA